MGFKRTSMGVNRRWVGTTFAVVVAVLMVTSVVVGPLGFVGPAAAAPGDGPYRVNAGGPQYTTADGTVFEADTANAYFHGGKSYLNAELQDGDIADTDDDTLYITERSGSGGFEYAFPVADGTYTVTLHLAEIYWGATGGGAGGEGKRVFDANIEGGDVELDDYDINAEVGPQTAVVKSYDVEVTDGELDVAFSASVNQPKLSAIEVVETEPEPNTLGGPSGTDFGAVVTGSSDTRSVTVRNLGGDGDPSVTLDGASVSGTDAGDFSTEFSGGVTLAPGESADIPVSFSPSDTGEKTATLDVSHSGDNSPLSVGLSGEGVNDAPIGFGKDSLSGFSAGNPTSLSFGPDGRLYVATQAGTLSALTVERNGPNDYHVTDEETIDSIKSIPNHDDDGSYNDGVNNRQVTGLTTAGTAAKPVLYVTSSDPRIGGGGSGSDTNLDTNSGAVSRLTMQTDGSWDHVMLVRGLPRSEENHATNGLQFDAASNTLYVAQGGHTNKGAPSNNFAYTPEYALSGAILSVDLDGIDGMSQKDAANTDIPYLYDIPTLSGTATPFGGEDGQNMGELVENGPVQIFSPGYRNPYDVTLTRDGQLYTVDNGPNGGWGGPPVGDGTATCTNQPNEDRSYSTGDNLHLVAEGSYGGHANPTRANPDGAGLYDSDGNRVGSVAGAVYDGYDGAEQCDYRDPTEDGSLDYGGFEAFGASTNGLDEYTASNFGGAMQGDLLASSFDGNIYRIQLNPAGDDLTATPDALLSSGGTLDVTTQGDDGEFPGTVWSANHGGNSVTVFEPNDYGNAGGDGGGGQCDASDPSGDADGDGYTNGDERAAGTDPCSAGSVPDDNDDDGVSDVTDTDDDNDGLADTTDPFAVDPENGLSTTLPVSYDFSRNSQPSSLEGIGFTGLMTNGQDYQDLYVPGDAVFGGANPALTQEVVKPGDAREAQNDQRHAYQFGIAPSDGPFVVHAPVTGYPDDPSDSQSAGIQLGTGDQDNYLKLVVAANGGTGGIQFAKEVGGSFESVAQPDDSSVKGPGTQTDLYLTVYPSNETVVASYTVDGGHSTTVGKTTIPAEWLSNQVDGQDVGLAVGVIATSAQSSEFSVTWNDFDVTPLGAGGSGNYPPTADAGADQTIDENTQVTLDGSASSDADGDQLGYSWTQTAGPDVSLNAQDAPQPTFTAPEVDAETTLTFEVTVSDGTATDTDTVNVTVQNTDSGTGGGGATTSADVTVNGGSGDIDESTFGSGSFSITNTGDTAIDSATIDLSESTLPDTVFDPEGSAGDEVAKDFTVDSGVGGTTTGSFARPHNGEDGADGYDVLNIGFTDFQPGETLTFSVDIDPTSIKGVSGSGGAGSVSGLELSGSSVAVTSADATVENDLFTDGSEGGSQANVSVDPPTAPSLGVEGVRLDSTDFPAHTAATVGENQQTLTVSGPADASVEVLHVVGSPASADGYDLDAFEADSATQVATKTVQLDANGEATTQVSLTEGSLDNFIAAVVDGERTGPTTGTVILEYDPTAGGGSNETNGTVFAVNAGGPAYTAADGTVYDADTNFDGGKTYTVGGSPAIENTANDPLYRTERYGDFAYGVPVENGEYEVTLEFAEIYHGVSANDDDTDGDQTGDRVFDVAIEGEPVLSNYDIYDEAGSSLAAVNETVTTTVTDGELDVGFTTVKDNAKISAIEVVKHSEAAANEPPNASFTVSESPTVGEDVTFDANGSSDPDGSVVSYAWTFGDGASATGENVTHAYDSAGEYDATLTVTDDDGATNATTRTVVVADATAPAVSVEPASLDFGAVGVGENARETVAVTNDGDAPLGVSSTAITGSDAGAFAVTDGSGPFTLAPGATRTLTVEFGPASAGEKSATLGIESNDTDEPNLEVALGGAGADVLTIENADGGLLEYEFAVGDTLAKSTAYGASVNDGDTVSGTTAAGGVFGGRDSYAFTGGLVSFAADANATVYLNGEEVDVGDLVSKHTLTIEGSGKRVDYDFEVGDDLEKSTALGASRNDLDTVSGSSASGGVIGGRDSYTYTGDIVSFAADGDTTVYLDGRKIDPSTVVTKNTVTIERTGDSGLLEYEFAVGDTLAKTTAYGASVNDGDTVSGTTAAGGVLGGRDSYAFTGGLVSFAADANATVYLNGEEVDVGDLVSKHTLTIEGSGKRVDYDFEVGDDLEKSTALGASRNDLDTVSGSSASGGVIGGRDSYTYTGDIVSFAADGDTTVYLDGRKIDPADFE